MAGNQGQFETSRTHSPACHLLLTKIITYSILMKSIASGEGPGADVAMMVVKLEMVWEHQGGQDDLPYIASDTGKVLSQLLQELGPAFEKEGITLSFHDSVLEPGSPVKQTLTVNGRSFDDVLLEVAGEQRQCEGRRWEMCLPISFQVVFLHNAPYTSVPELLLRKALLRAAGII